MTSRLHRIEIQNFKAFRSFTLDLEGRHLLVYGPNGSGKSSLYWALYTFLQSAHKSTPEVAKYFDPAGEERLHNLHEQREPTPQPGKVALTFRDATGAEIRDVIGLTDHSTRQKPFIQKGDLASDFVTYRYLFRFSNFRNSALLDVWPLFKEEILPFCVSTSSVRPADLWARISDGDPNPWRFRGTAGGNAYDSFLRDCDRFATVLDEVVGSIGREAQAFYDTHFAADDPEPIRLQLRVTQQPTYIGRTQHGTFVPPEIGFGIQVGGDQVERPQAFLNEAKLTQLALSIRFAASLVNLHESAVKLLVLDDLLISLDMSNRMKVVEILLSETFKDYQKVFLTHDYGFFQECRRKIGSGHTDWAFLKISGTPATEIQSKTVKTDAQQAETYLDSGDLTAAALSLRKAAEETVSQYLARDTPADAPKEFVGLADKLRNARNRLELNLTTQLYKRVLRGVPDGNRALIVPTDHSDLDEITTLSQEERGRLKTQRRRLRQLFESEHMDRLKSIELVNDVLQALERVLNPAAHAGSAPLYKSEVEDALDLIKDLEAALSAPAQS